MALPDSPPSLWLADYGSYVPSRPLADRLDVDVAIVGGGFQGLATAIALRKTAPSLRIVVLEHEFVGYGASGRNGSFAMTVFGLGFATMVRLRGRELVRDAHRYMERAVDGLERLIREHGMHCDVIRPGFLRVATTASHERRLRAELDLVKQLGIEGIDWLERDAVRAKVNSALYRGGTWEPRLLLVNPAKLVREEKRVALTLGAEVYEHTPVTHIRRGRRLVLETPHGTVSAEKVVLATNAYSIRIPELRRKQIPAWTYMIATEPLGARHFADIGWAERNGVEDARNLIHYYRISPDARLVMGGGPVGLGFGTDLEHDVDPSAWRHLEEHMRFLFPVLRDVRVTHRWGGPFSVTVDLTPALGYLGDRRMVYALGCIGHGVSMTHQNALTLVDLLLERQSENTACPFVNRRVIPWPPEPLRSLAARGVRTYLRAEDWWHERGGLRPSWPPLRHRPGTL